MSGNESVCLEDFWNLWKAHAASTERVNGPAHLCLYLDSCYAAAWAQAAHRKLSGLTIQCAVDNAALFNVKHSGEVNKNLTKSLRLERWAVEWDSRFGTVLPRAPHTARTPGSPRVVLRSSVMCRSDGPRRSASR
jgi:hypothetical protein